MLIVTQDIKRGALSPWTTSLSFPPSLAFKFLLCCHLLVQTPEGVNFSFLPDFPGWQVQNPPVVIQPLKK